MANQDSKRSKATPQKLRADDVMEKITDQLEGAPEISQRAAAAILRADSVTLLKKAALGKKLTTAERQIIAQIAGTDGGGGGGQLWVKSKPELCKALGTTRPTLDKALKAMKARGIDPHRPNGLWNVAEARNGMVQCGIGNLATGEDDESLSKYEQLRTEALLVKIEEMRLDLGVKRGEFLTMREHEIKTAEAFGVIKHYLLSRWDSLAVQLAGHPVPEIKRRGKANDMDILMQFATRDWPAPVRDILRRFLLWYESEGTRNGAH